LASETQPMKPRKFLTAPVEALLDGVQHFFAFYRWMTEWDAMKEPLPLREAVPLRCLIVRLALKVATALLLLDAIFGMIWLLDSGLQAN
jgi:hypothetical protein